MSEPTSIDHLAGKTGRVDELLAVLTDEQLAEQLTYWKSQQEIFRQGFGSGAAYSAHRYGRWATKAQAMLESRHA